MGEIAIQVVRWLVKLGPYLGAIVAFIIIVNISASFLFIGFNMGALSDIYAMVSMWLPFNLSVIMMWIMTASTAYITYRLAWVAVQWINRLLE